MFGKSAKFLLSHPFEFSSFKSVFVFKGFRFLFSLNLCPRGRGAGAPRGRGAESDSPSCPQPSDCLSTHVSQCISHVPSSTLPFLYIFHLKMCHHLISLLIFSLSNNQKVWTRIFIEIWLCFHLTFG